MTDWRIRHGGRIRFSLLCCLFGLLTGCTLPTLDGRSVSSALGDEEARATQLGQAIAPRVEEHPGKSGIYPLQNSLDAFAARVLLTQAAERTLDIQYYI